MTKNAEVPVHYYKYRPGRWEIIESNVIVESSVALSVNGEVWLTFMCTPTDLEALAVGFLFNEGWINTPSEIVAVSICASGDNIDVWLDHPVEKPAVWKRTTGCSGGLTAPNQPASILQVEEASRLSPQQILRAMDQLLDGQQLYRSSRGVHASALSDGEHILARSEDIGRHNTLDKISGIVLLEKIDQPGHLLITTGRISSEMLQKTNRMGVPVLVSRTAPNALSIQSAQELGITLIGYARRDQFHLYTHPERIQGVPLEPEVPTQQTVQGAAALD